MSSNNYIGRHERPRRGVARKMGLLLAVFSLLSFQRSNCLAQGTAFTYQGQLNQEGAPASGSYDLTFGIWTAASGGTQAGTTLTNAGVSVSNGLFTVMLDFGPGIFPGANRWLEIAVGMNGGALTTLSPRQSIAATPYAITASNLTGLLPAGQLSGTLTAGQLSGTYSNAMILSNAANSFAGNGGGLTGLNANNLTSGTVPAGALSNAWKTTGNAGTLPPSNFLGTTDNEPLNFRVDNQRAFRLEAPGSNSVNVIGGWSGNNVSGGAVGATIGGGGAGNYFGLVWTNQVAVDFGTVGGGAANMVGAARYGTIGGGYGNTLQSNAYASVISGGYVNTVQSNASQCFIGGGQYNTIELAGTWSTISGGQYNSIGTNAYNCTIGGGQNNSIGTNTWSATIGGGVGNTVGTNAPYSAIAGGAANTIQNNAGTSTIAGGDDNTVQSNATYCSIGGGYNNTIQSEGAESTIAGGRQNQIGVNSPDSVVGGGIFNTIEASAGGSVIGGGYSNTIAPYSVFVNGTFASITGGLDNFASGLAATVGGGYLNVASGNYSFAAGQNAQAVNNGSFVWADDSTTSAFTSTAANQFIIRATGGVGIGTATPGYTLEVNGSAHRVDNSPNWTVASDRRLKRDIVELGDGLATIERLRPVRFRYREDYLRAHPGATDEPHFGVVAQEYQEVFPDFVQTGVDGLLSVDVSPITFYNAAAIHELNQKFETALARQKEDSEAKDAKIGNLEHANRDLQERLAALEHLVQEIKASTD
jgi:trimeric autotransporter adhesin